MWRVLSHVILFILINIFKASCEEPRSLTFVIGDSLSMIEDMDHVKASIDKIMNRVFDPNSRQISNMVLVTFNEDAQVIEVTTNRTIFKSALNNVPMHSYNNFDCEEMSMKGILKALESSGEGSYIYVFTDASAKDYYESEAVKEMCQRKQAQIVFVLTGYCKNIYDISFQVYYDIAATCSGFALYIPKNEVYKVLQTIEETVKANNTVMTTRIVAPEKYTDIPFTIDELTEDAIIAATGDFVTLGINGPAAQITTMLWTRNSKMVKVSNPTPGQYVASVMGLTLTSVTIIGGTDFHFRHSFSELEPKSPSETAPQPIIGAKNAYLSISVTDPQHLVNITSAQILTIDETIMQPELPLKEISKGFYVTKPFAVPPMLFKVAVKGILKSSGKSITRIAKLPVTSQNPPREVPNKTRPVANIEEGQSIEVEAGSKVRLTCKVTAYPEPTIKWINSTGAPVKSLSAVLQHPYAYISYLEISNITGKDKYMCYAANFEGLSSQIINVIAKNAPGAETLPPAPTPAPDSASSSDISHNTSTVYILQGETKKLECAEFKNSESVQWSISQGGVEKKVSEPYINLEKASVSDDGNYTCRATDKDGNTQTYNYLVDVGYPPKLPEDKTLLDDWRGDKNVILANCQSISKPPADIEWKLNGKELTGLNITEPRTVIEWGQYECNVSNVHGAVQRSFDVKSTACLIRRNLKDEKQIPLLLNDDLTWPTWKYTQDYLIVEHEGKITLSCPHSSEASNSFQNFPKQSEIKAICDKQDEFLVDGKNYKLSDLRCSNDILPSIVKENVKCSTETSELIRVGYNVSSFLQVYEVCFDNAKNMPLYIRVLVPSADGSLSTTQNWLKYPGIGDENVNRGFTCDSSLLSCCYNKSQLLDARDLLYASAQKITFIDYLNAVACWQPCKDGQTTWEVIGDMVRSQLKNYNQVVAWSGTHTLQEKDGAVTPRFLWKVLRFDEDKSIAIVHVNDPSPTDEDIKCENICTKSENTWFTASDKYTYCCKLTDFLEAFNMKGTDIGVSLKTVIKKEENKT